MELIPGLLLILLLLLIYILPISLAYKNKIRNRHSLYVVNIFLGWTLIGWVVCLAWSVSSSREDAPSGSSYRQSLWQQPTQQTSMKEPTGKVYQDWEKIACAKCGQTFDPDMKSCPHCGTRQ